MVRRTAMTKTRVREERSRESLWSIRSARPYPALHAARAAQPLGSGDFLHLFVAHRTGVLVAVALLDCRDSRRGARVAVSAFLGGLGGFRLRALPGKTLGR